MPIYGWGEGGFGSGPWGGGLGTGGIEVLTIEATRENVIRLELSAPLAFTGLGDLSDPSRPVAWRVDPIVPDDGSSNPRPVGVARVEPAPVAELPGVVRGTVVDVYLDRSLSPFPARYTLTVGAAGALLSVDGQQEIEALTVPFLGLTADASSDAELDAPTVGQDLALTAPGEATNVAIGVGGYATDESGDYAFDRGRDGLRKRVFRRVFTRRNGFSFLVGYGGGLLEDTKRAAKSSTLVAKEEECAAQIAEEPDVASAVVRIQRRADPGTGLFGLSIRVVPRVGSPAVYRGAYRSE